MKNGKLIKEKWEYTRERFKTQEGLFDFFVGTAIWSFAIINYNQGIFSWIQDLFKGISIPYIADYLALLLFGILSTIAGLLISYILIEAFHMIKGDTQ